MYTAILWLCAFALPQTSDDPVTTGKPELEIGHEVGQRVPRFTARISDLTKEKSTTPLDSHATERPTAYLFITQSCPTAKGYRERIIALAQQCKKQRVDFLLIYPKVDATDKSKKEHHRSTGLAAAGFLNDRRSSIAKKLGITRTPEVVFTSKHGEVLYRGGLDDSPGNAKKVKKAYLANAIAEHLAGKKVTITKAPAFGCPLEF